MREHTLTVRRDGGTVVPDSITIIEALPYSETGVYVVKSWDSPAVRTPDDGRNYVVIWLEPGESMEALPDSAARELYRILKEHFG